MHDQPCPNLVAKKWNFKLAAAAKMWGQSTWNPSSSVSGIQT